jgi:hypothetical protein
MGYCVNSSGALVPFASDRAACSSVGGKFVENIKPTFNQDAKSGEEWLNPKSWEDASKNIAGWGSGEGYDIRKGQFPPIGKLLDILNPVPEVSRLINNLSDPELQRATINFVYQNPLKATLAGVTAYLASKGKKIGLPSLTRSAYMGNVATEALSSGIVDEALASKPVEFIKGAAKKEIERGMWNIHGGEPIVEGEQKPPPTVSEEEQKKLDEQAADDLAKNRTSTETARKSFSERFKAGMKDPATLNKLGMLMDYYGRNLQDRGENPLIAYEKAKADQMAASKPDVAAFNAVDMTNDALYDIFTPKKGWFKMRSEADRDKAAAIMVGRYRTIQNAALTRHGVILTHAEIMKLLEKERDERLAAQKAAANK